MTSVPEACTMAASPCWGLFLGVAMTAPPSAPEVRTLRTCGCGGRDRVRESLAVDSLFGRAAGSGAQTHLRV